MPYCVHCGVELDPTAAACPLCQTPVQDPNCPVDTVSPKPFPQDPGEVPPVSRTELALLLSAMFLSVALCCGLLNLFFHNVRWWSLYGIGLALLLWVWFVPPLIFRKMPLPLRLFLDAAGVGGYVALIALELGGWNWYFGVALPILLVGAALVVGLGFLLEGGRRSILSSVTLIIGAIGLFTVAVEFFVERYLTGAVDLTWSLLVLAICVSLIIPLIVVRRVPSLREEARKRFHM